MCGDLMSLSRKLPITGIPFLLKGVGFSQAEIGVVNKVIGIWLTILGAILGGVLMVRL